MNASHQQVSGILGRCNSCWHAQTTCEFCSVSFKKLSLSNWPEREVQHSLCVHSFTFFFFVLFWVLFWLFSGTLFRGKSVTKPQAFGELAPNYVFASKHSTGQGSCALHFAEKNLLSTPEPTPLTKSRRKYIQLTCASAGWELNCFLFEGWTLEFSLGV